MKLLIIAPFFMHQELLSLYRKDDPFFSLKLMSKAELLLSSYGQYKKEAISYLIKKEKVNYDNALTLLKYIPYARESESIKINHLYDLKKDLLTKGLLEINEYLLYELKNYEIFVYGYSELDKELSHFLNTQGLKAKFIKHNVNIHVSNVTEYKKVEEEVLYCLNKIANLIHQGVALKNIIIINQNEEYDYYLKTFSSSFGFNLNIANNETLYTKEYSSLFFQEYEKQKDINKALETLDEEDDEIKEFKQIITENIITDFSFEQQKDYYVSLLKRSKINSVVFDNAIKVSRDLLYCSNKHIFVLGFIQGKYPAIHKDKDYLNNVDKESLHLNTTDDLTKISIDLINDFFSSDNTFYVSYSLLLHSQELNPSSLMKQYGIKNATKPILPPIIYSRFMADYLFADKVDLEEIYYEKDEDFYSLNKLCEKQHKYDNSFNGVIAYNQNNKIRYSYSSIKNYFSCPFLYYLKSVLSLKENMDELFNAKLGTFFHAVLERLFDIDFNFEAVYQKVFASMNFTPREQALCIRLKKQLKDAVDASSLHYKDYMESPVAYVEKQCEYYINPKTSIYGIIDKAIIVDGSYLVLVDYKTGKESFHKNLISYGQSLQLPTYMLLADSNECFKDLPIVGLYINNVINPSINEENIEDQLIQPHLKLNGITINNQEIIYKIDKTFDGLQTTFIKGVKFVKKNNALGGPVASQEEINSFKDLALSKYLEADNLIRHNVFTIAPVHIGSNVNPCQYCSFRDVCFLKNEQIVYYDAKEEKVNESRD